MEKNSFLLHKNHREIFEALPDEQAAKLLLAVFDYEETHIEPELDGVLKVAFIPIRQWLDENRASYEATCKKNTENGRKGGRPKKQADNEETQKTQRLSEKPKKAEYDYDSDSDSEYDYDYEYDHEGTDVPVSAPIDAPQNPKHSKQVKEVKYTDVFLDFWDKYPRKVNKQNAFKAWKKLKVNDVVFAGIIDGLKRANASPAWVKNIKEQTPEFIPHASTWLNGRRWEDEIDNRGSPKKAESKYAKAWGAKS